jgi:hypothetical protein
MQQKLSEYYINKVEDFIVNHNPNNEYPAITYYDREQAIDDWNTINSPETTTSSYFRFAENAFGMVVYGFYKAKNGKIYIINSYCNKIQCYYNIDSNWTFITNI